MEAKPMELKRRAQNGADLVKGLNKTSGSIPHEAGDIGLFAQWQVANEQLDINQRLEVVRESVQAAYLLGIRDATPD